MKKELTYIAVRSRASDSIAVQQVEILSLTDLRIKYTIDGGTPKVNDYDLSAGSQYLKYIDGDSVIADIEFVADEHGNVYWYVGLASSVPFQIDGASLVEIPKVIVGTTITETPDKSFYAPRAESRAAFKERMMPYLHEAALNFAKQASPHVANITGHSRGVLRTVQHTASKHKAESSMHIGDLPIGFCMWQLQATVDKTEVIERDALENAICDAQELWENPDAWWTHHIDINHDAWNKHLAAHRLLHKNANGDTTLLFDIQKHIKSNLPGASSQELIESESEKIFHALATQWYEKALYASIPDREYVTERTLVLEEKEDVNP